MKAQFTSSILVIILLLTAASFAQQPNVRSFPYMAEITGDDVYIRSGPGTNYYDCGKFNKGDVVKVVDVQHGWSRIAPPAGSFSWISKQYVDVDPNTPQIGTVTGDAVRVYAGSDHVKPLYSTTLQGKLNRQEKVKLLGEEKGGYLKIAPPPFAYLWVSSQYTKPVDQTIPAKPPQPKKISAPVMPSPKEPPVITEPPAPKESTMPMTDRLAYYKTLEQQLKAEKQKPLQQQNYDKIKAGLKRLADGKAEDKAARYAEYALENIKRCELAQEINQRIKQQNQQLDKIMRRIENAKDNKLNDFPDLGRYDAIGNLMISAEYSAEKHHRHYRLVDDTGKTICYALPIGPAANLDLTGMLGRKVGVVGKIMPHPQSAGAIIEFTTINVIN